MKTYPVIWTLPAIASLPDIFNFIKTDSPTGAKNVVTALVTLGNSLATIEDESVMIVEVFDTRRDPSRLKVEP